MTVVESRVFHPVFSQSLFIVSASSTPRTQETGHDCVNSPGAVLQPRPPRLFIYSPSSLF